MRALGAFRMVMFLPVVLLGLALLGWVTMSLWNWLMPALFGWKTISYWQAWGLFVLSKLLFGGFFGPGGRGGYRRYRMRDRWEYMTPEEREAFRQWLRGRFGGGPEPGPRATV